MLLNCVIHAKVNVPEADVCEQVLEALEVHEAPTAVLVEDVPNEFVYVKVGLSRGRRKPTNYYQDLYY